MLATPHMVVGAAIGKVLRRPWLAWPVAFGSHFLLDFTPHLDSHTLFGAEAAGPTLPEAAVALADILLGIGIVLWLVREHARRAMVGGAFFGIAIDIIENVPALQDWFIMWPGTAWLSQFHHSFQHNVTPAQWPLGVGTQVAVVVIAVWVCLRLSRPRRSLPSPGARGLRGLASEQHPSEPGRPGLAGPPLRNPLC